MSAEPARITVALGIRAARDLEKIRQTTRLTKADIVNQAVSLYAFVEEELSEGGECVIRRPDGTQYLLKMY
jgi:hypothetical protein